MNRYTYGSSPLVSRPAASFSTYSPAPQSASKPYQIKPAANYLSPRPTSSISISPKPTSSIGYSLTSLPVPSSARTYASPATPLLSYTAPQAMHAPQATYRSSFGTVASSSFRYPTSPTYAAPAYTVNTQTYAAPVHAVDTRTYTKSGSFKVCVCGGSGGIGQPLSLLMATDLNCGELSVYDLSVAMVPPQGVAADLGHLEKKAKVTGYVKTLEEKAIDVLGECLTGCSLVLVPAGVPRKPGQTRDDLFKINAGIAKEVVEACAKYCPEAIVALIVNPVNSVVPAMAELYRKAGLDPHKIVGVTTLDCVRANKFVAELTGVDPDLIDVPVIGGHAGVTIMPVFSQDAYARTIPEDQIPDLDKHVQEAGTEVVNAKGGKGSATLSMAYAGARLGKAILSGLNGTPVTECAYVLSDVVEGLPYFTSKVTFGVNGVEQVHPLGELSEYEQNRLEEACNALQAEIQSGLDYADSTELSQ